MGNLHTPPDLGPATKYILELMITGLAGLEPTTYGLGNRRSIRLSYSPTGMNYAFEALWTVKAGEVIAIETYLLNAFSFRLRKVRAPRWPNLLVTPSAGDREESATEKHSRWPIWEFPWHRQGCKGAVRAHQQHREVLAW